MGEAVWVVCRVSGAANILKSEKQKAGGLSAKHDGVFQVFASILVFLDFYFITYQYGTVTRNHIYIYHHIYVYIYMITRNTQH